MNRLLFTFLLILQSNLFFFFSALIVCNKVASLYERLAHIMSLLLYHHTNDSQTLYHHEAVSHHVVHTVMVCQEPVCLRVQPVDVRTWRRPQPITEHAGAVSQQVNCGPRRSAAPRGPRELRLL